MATHFSAKVSNQLKLAKKSILRGDLLPYLDHLAYRVFRKGWARLQGHSFHRSSLFWLREGDGIHTRAAFLLPRLKFEFPEIRLVEVALKIFSEEGKCLASHSYGQLPVETPFVIDSRHLPPSTKLPASFSGSALVTLKLILPDKTIFEKHGIFDSTHTYLDYFREGDFVSTLHDYSAFLPDQPLAETMLGMIPAYLNTEQETFVIFHATSDGIRKKDIEMRLFNEKGDCLKTFVPAITPFGMRRLKVTDLFPDAASFLQGKMGQIVAKGIFRKLLRRTAYGIENKRTGAFSLDHCYYNIAPDKTNPFPAAQRDKIQKGWSNPFFVKEDVQTCTRAMLFQSSEDPDDKHLDLLIYDMGGKCVAKVSPYIHLKGDQVHRADLRKVLTDHGISLPFMGHAEFLYHNDPSRKYFPKDLDIYVEYEAAGRPATVIFGADVWNSPKPVQNRSYRSTCRVVCNQAHTTYVAISNCSYAYDYDLKVPFTISLTADATHPLESKRFELGPNASFFQSVDELFPNAAKLLEKSGGVGFLTTTDINCAYLTHLFFTQDRSSGALSVEHSLDV